MTTITEAPAAATDPQPATTVPLTIEYLTVAMDGQDSCGSCDAALTAVTTAIERIRPLAGQIGITLELQPHTVTSWSEAAAHQIVASPTIRAAGIELHPTHPDNTETRLWHWRGTTSATANMEAILDLLLRAVANRSEQLGAYLASGGPAPYVRQHLDTADTVTAEPQPATVDGCGSTCG